MIINKDGEYDPISEGQMDALIQVSHHTQANDDEDGQVYFDNDASPSLVVSKVLTLQQEIDENQSFHIFHTKAGKQGRSIKVVIDGGNCVRTLCLVCARSRLTLHSSQKFQTKLKWEKEPPLDEFNSNGHNESCSKNSFCIFENSHKWV